jgi:hypothetical protein
MKIRLSVTSSRDGIGWIRYDAEIEPDKGTSLEAAEAHVRSLMKILDEQMADGEDDEDDDEDDWKEPVQA